LTASSFTIANKSVIEEIIASTQPDITVSVAIVFDLSGSMGNDRDNKASKRTQSALAALARFVQKSNPANEYFLIGFNDKIHLIRTQFQDATETIADINSMASLSFINGAALYDALQVAIKKLSPSNFSKQAIILVTDSYDDSSKGTFKDTVRLLEQTNTLVYPIFLLPDSYSDLTGSRGGPYDETGLVLKEFASLGGGRYFQAKRGEELNGIVDRIAIELRSQYLIKVGLANNLDKKCYEFKLKLLSNNKSDLKSSVRTRKAICIP